MSKKWLIIFLTLFLVNNSTKSQDNSNINNGSIAPLYFKKPNFLKSLSYIPGDMLYIAKSPFYKKDWMILAGITAGTYLIQLKDQGIINWVKKSSLQAGLDPTTRYYNAVKFGDTKIIKVPKNLNTALYQLGEGGTSMMVAGGLWIYGKIKHDYRAIQTCYDLTETFATMGITTQILKRISGRESPFKSTAPGGKWTPLPSFKAYQTHTPTYDAFPSGHLATMVATVTVLTKDYPEKKWIKPIGYSLIGLTGWAMMNTEVHWLSDYPLAIAVGYLSGKITTLRHHKTPIAINKIENY